MFERLSARFGRDVGVVARAPGRVNLIGEHTDYNAGFVLPVATEQETWVAAAGRDDGEVRAYSTELDDERAWSVNDSREAGLPHWTSYVAGVAALLRERGAGPNGADLLIRSSVPPGGGLSSSAALEVATALALTALTGTTLEDRELIDLCRQAEHEYAGVPCGLMDQSVSLCARAGTALLLDCRSRDCVYIPCQLEDHLFVVIDSGVRHELAAGEYAKRHSDCRRAVDYFHQLDPAVTALRDVSSDTLRERGSTLEPIVAARARHVVSENARTLAAVEALRTGDLAGFGRLMQESHCSLRDDYAVSCPEVDSLVRIVSTVDGVLGARMTGGGFGGCIVALMAASSVSSAQRAIASQYEAANRVSPTLIRTRPSRGASVESR